MLHILSHENLELGKYASLKFDWLKFFYTEFSPSRNFGSKIYSTLKIRPPKLTIQNFDRARILSCVILVAWKFHLGEMENAQDLRPFILNLLSLYF